MEVFKDERQQHLSEMTFKSNLLQNLPNDKYECSKVLSTFLIKCELLVSNIAHLKTNRWSNKRFESSDGERIGTVSNFVDSVPNKMKESIYDNSTLKQLRSGLKHNVQLFMESFLTEIGQASAKIKVACLECYEIKEIDKRVAEFRECLISAEKMISECQGKNEFFEHEIERQSLNLDNMIRKRNEAHAIYKSVRQQRQFAYINRIQVEENLSQLLAKKRLCELENEQLKANLKLLFSEFNEISCKTIRNKEESVWRTDDIKKWRDTLNNVKSFENLKVKLSAVSEQLKKLNSLLYLRLEYKDRSKLLNDHRLHCNQLTEYIADKHPIIKKTMSTLDCLRNDNTYKAVDLHSYVAQLTESEEMLSMLSFEMETLLTEIQHLKSFIRIKESSLIEGKKQIEEVLESKSLELFNDFNLLGSFEKQISYLPSQDDSFQHEEDSEFNMSKFL